MTFTFELGETAAAPAVGTLQEILVPVLFVVLTAGLDLVVGEALPQGVHVLGLAFVGGAHETLKAAH